MWFSYINSSENTSKYLIYPICPRGHCYPDTPVDINLNIPSGEDAQCAYSRSGVLCGGCRRGLSLSLGGSQCLKCPAHWPVILVVIIIGLFLEGIVLVALILILNLTIAVGTLNGLIFCANLISINSESVQSVNSPGVLGTFIAWLNLNFGLNTCFYEGMNAYSKAWIELLFPMHIIFITVVLHFLSQYTTYFAKFVEKKNPIATLGTLVLLSYVRCLRTITSSYSFAILHYPDNSSQVVWLPDGNVFFLKGKHIALFIMATIVLLIGITYTIVLFSWQWIVHYQQRKFFKWLTNKSLFMFFDLYSAPFSTRHRYWPGLLLFVHIVVYTVSTVNISGNICVNSFTTGILVSGLFILKGFLGTKLYKKKLVEIIEVLSYVNILGLCFGWLYVSDSIRFKVILLYISEAATLFLFCIVLVYHASTEILVDTKFVKLLMEKLRKLKGKDNHQVLLAPLYTSKSEPIMYSVVDPPTSEEQPVCDSSHKSNSSEVSIKGTDDKQETVYISDLTTEPSSSYELKIQN